MGAIDKASEAWRAECEARHLLALPDPNARRRYLKQVQEARGAQSRQALEDDAMRLFNAAKRTSAAPTDP